MASGIYFKDLQALRSTEGQSPTGFEQYESVSEWRQNFYFWVNYTFKVSSM